MRAHWLRLTTRPMRPDAQMAAFADTQLPDTALADILTVDDCPMCPECVGGDGRLMAIFGTRAHYRCYACSFTFTESLS